MVNNNIPLVLQGIHEIESSYNNLSCVLSSYNIKQVIRPYLLSENITDEDINNRLDNFLTNIWQSNIALNDEIISIITDYYNDYLGFEDFILEDFINFTVREDINKLVELRYIGTNKGRKEVPLSNSYSNKNLVCNFKGKELFKLQKEQGREHTPDDILEYYCTFFLLTLLVILYNIVSSGSFVTAEFAGYKEYSIDEEDNLKKVTQNIDIEVFYELFHRFISLNITTGVEMYAEFQLDCNAGELIEEVKQLTPTNKMELDIGVNDEKEAITIRVKNSFLLNDGFIKDGYFKTSQEYDKALDSKSQSTFRITRGSNPCSILFTAKITGMRTISRLLSTNANPTKKIYIWTMFNSGAIGVAHILSFFFRSIVNHCENTELINKSYYTAFNKFIQNYTPEQRSVPLKTALVFLLSKQTPENRKVIIDKYLDEKKCSKQRTELRKVLKAFDSLVQEDIKYGKIIDRFIKTLEKYYAW